MRVSGRGRRWLAGGHPWLYANDVESEDAEPGALVVVEDAQGAVLGRGFFSAGSKIRVRLVRRGAGPVDPDFWRERAERAVGLRRDLGLLDPRDACRLVSGDADGFPGFVVDRYADVLVVSSGTQAADRERDAWLDLVARALPFSVRAVVERSESGARKHEGLAPRSGLLSGELGGEVEVVEGDLSYTVDVLAGHKTGHYLDQRENRRRAALRAAGRSVLDVCCYDGLFGVRAAMAGARDVLLLDQSESALARALENAARNRVAERVRAERGDALPDLRARVERGECYGLVIVDPPAFARNKAELPGALRGYRELNLRALKLLEPGGTLVSASCSHAVRPALFVEVLAAAAADAGRAAFLDQLSGASLDHPELLTLPESGYLKCAFVRVA